MRVTDCQVEFEHQSHMACCAVLVLPELCDPLLRSWLQPLVWNGPATRWILVTRYSRENARCLLDLRGVNLVVWIEELDHVLAPAVLEVLRTDGLDLIVKVLRSADGTSSELVQSLGSACLSSPPIHTVRGLSRKLGVSEYRLRSLWKNRTRAEKSPKELLEWILLARAIRLKRSFGAWSRVAQHIGVKEDTLRELCRRRTGLTLSQLEKEESPGFRSRIAEWWTVTWRG